MRKFNIYTKSRIISTETEEELFKDLDKKIKIEIDILKLGDRYIYTIKKKTLEIERVV